MNATVFPEPTPAASIDPLLPYPSASSSPPRVASNWNCENMVESPAITGATLMTTCSQASARVVPLTEPPITPASSRPLISSSTKSAGFMLRAGISFGTTSHLVASIPGRPRLQYSYEWPMSRMVSAVLVTWPSSPSFHSGTTISCLCSDKDSISSSRSASPDSSSPSALTASPLVHRASLISRLEEPGPATLELSKRYSLTASSDASGLGYLTGFSGTMKPQSPSR